MNGTSQPLWPHIGASNSPMVITSNWPEFVEISTVRRWRSMFSSSVTQRTWMPGLSRSNSDDSRCMTIMSLLFTVATVTVVSARAPAATLASAAASAHLNRFA